MSGTVGPRKLRLLDFFPNAAVAYSLRKLRLNYNGSVVRVRRSNDNESQDIGFLGNYLDTQTMIDFVGYNLFLYSEDLSNGYWAKTNLNPISTDVETAPDGTLTADKIVENATTGNHFISRFNTTLISSTTYNISVYLKAAERTQVYVDSEIEGTYKNALINLTAGTITSTTFTNTPILSNEGNGWYRFSVNVTTPSIVSPSVPIRVFLYNGVSINYAGNGTSGAYVWGFQFSKTSEVKPYRKTTATAGGSGFVSIWYDQSGNGNDLSQVTVANQPRIVNNGDLETKGNKVSIYSVSSDLLTRASLAFGNYPFNLSVFSVSYNEVALANASVFSTNTPLAGAGIQHFCDRRTQKRNTILYGATVVNTYDLSVQRDDSNQRLLSLFMNASTNATSAFDNGNAGTAGTVTGGIHTETAFNVLGTSSSGIQELIIYKADNSANRTGIESNINSYYSIY